MRSSSRKATLAFALLLQCPTSLAFVSPTISLMRPSLLSADLSTTTTTLQSLLFATKSSTFLQQEEKDDSSPAYVRQPLLTVEETTILLKQAKEWKRIKDLERSLAASKSPRLPYLSFRAQEAGYGSNWEAYEQALREGAAARETLVSRNMGLVYHCVTQIIGTKRQHSFRGSLSREDLIQEGALGLARAIDKYDLERSSKSDDNNDAAAVKFSTYAVYWIRAAILRGLAEKDDYMMRVPEHVSSTISKVQRAAKRLGLPMESQLWKEAQAAKWLAEEAGVTSSQVENAMQVRQRRRKGSYVSLESSSEYEQSTLLFSKVLTSTLEDDEKSSLQLVQLRPIRGSLDTDKIRTELSKYLRPKEMEAISWRYGLLMSENQEQQQQRKRPVRPTSSADNNNKKIVTKGKTGEAMSFQEVGKQMQVSAEYGRRLCHQALNKLRRAAEEGHLQSSQLYFA